jgi:hypothetical protein
MIRQLITKLDKSLPEWRDISEPETLSIVAQNNNIDISEIEMDMINAIKTILTVDTPWEDPFIFENIVDAFNGDPVIPEVLTKPPLRNIVLTVSAMNEIKEKKFSDNVAKYIAAIAIDDSMIYLPPPLDFANKFIPNIRPELRNKLKNSITEIMNTPFDYPFKETEEDIQIVKILVAFHF